MGRRRCSRLLLGDSAGRPSAARAADVACYSAPMYRNRNRNLAACATALLVAACGGGAAPPGGETADADRRFLSVGTAPPGGAFFVVGGALAEVIGEAEPAWTVTAEATKGTQENIRRLVTGELDLALANSAITYFAVRGEGGWETAQRVLSVMTLAPNVALFLTPDDSGIGRIADLAGRRVVVGPAGAGFEYFVRPIVEAHGLAWDAFTPLYGTQAAAVDLLADGSAAAAFLGGAVPTASITQATSGGGVRFVPFDPAVRDRLIADFPFFRPATVPAGTYPGQEADFEGLDVGSMHLVAAESAPEELVYRLTKLLWEGRDRVVERHPAGRAIREGNVTRDTGTPFHPGAILFYREAGLWDEAPTPDDPS